MSVFFINQIDELINAERKAYYLYLTWFALILTVGILFLFVSWLQEWLNSLGPSLSSAFLLLLSKPSFSEMMKRRERIRVLKSLERMVQITTPESKEREEVEKLVFKTFKNMLKL